MDASKETNVSDSRVVYTPPMVVRISDLKQGVGYCATQGSGDVAGCTPTGSTAAGGGCTTGNTAATRCAPSGNNPVIGT